MRRVSQTAYRCHRPTLSAWAGFALPAALLCLPLLTTIASADTVTLRDGTSYEGRVTERQSDQIKFEVSISPGVSFTKAIPLRDIVTLTVSRPEAAKLADEFRGKWSGAEQAGTAAAFAELGKWAQDNKLHDEAVSAYEKACRLDPERKADYGYAAACNLALANRLRQARARLKELAAACPDNDQIAAELARLEQQAQKQVDERLRQALDSYRKGDMRSAIATMERLTRMDVDDVTALADQSADQQASMSFGRLLAEARLAHACEHCNGEMQSGLVACPQCHGAGKVLKTRLETLTEKDPKSGIERRRTYQVEYQAVCPSCRGFSAIICPTCNGAGVDLGTVGPAEKPYVIDGLRRRIDALSEKLAGGLADPSSLHPVNLEVVHLGGLRLRYYVQQYVLLNSDLAGDDLISLNERRGKLDNLLRHTTAQYRSRDLEEYKKVLEAQLMELARREGILTPGDLDYREPPEPSTTDIRRPNRN